MSTIEWQTGKEKKKEKKKETSSVSLFHYLFYDNVISQGATTYHYYLGFFKVGLYFVFQISLHLVDWFGRIIVFFYYQSPGQFAMGAGYRRCVFFGRKAQCPSIIIPSGSRADGYQASRGWWIRPLRLLTHPHALIRPRGRAAFPKGLTLSLCLWSGYIGGEQCLLHTKEPLGGRKNSLLRSITAVPLSLWGIGPH